MPIPPPSIPSPPAGRLHRHESGAALKRQRAALESRYANLVTARPRPAPTLHGETLRALVDALDLREQETAGHSHRVALWTLLFAAWCDVAESELEAIHAGALLHDVGKIAIPDPILLKRGRLDAREWVVMRTHPSAGHRLLARTTSLRSAAAIPWCHHERFDGSGYPRGLSGKRIPLCARLFAIVDVYDALRSDRPYKVAYTHEHSIELMRAQSGRHFDPQLCARFFDLPQAALERLTPSARKARPYAELREIVAQTLAWIAARPQGGGPKAPDASSAPALRVRLMPRTRTRLPRSGS